VAPFVVVALVPCSRLAHHRWHHAEPLGQARLDQAEESFHTVHENHS
jgi:hypothetical protein